jgi:cold shock CspA family protein
MQEYALLPDEEGIAQGTVKDINLARCFGFIVTPDIPLDVFFHRSIHKQQHIRVGDVVTFAYKRMEDGRYRATRIIKVEDK